MASRTQSRMIALGATLLALLLAVQILRLRAAEYSLRWGEPWGAAVRPQNARAQALLAERSMLAGNAERARAHALAALDNSLLQVRALRTLAVLADRSRPGAGHPLWRLAAAHGWRDGPTQLWAFRQALLQGELDIAVARADAFLRTRSDRSPAGERQSRETIKLLRRLAAQAPIAGHVAERLATRPEWRSPFFELADPAPADELRGVATVTDQLGNIGDRPSRHELHALIIGLIRAGRYDAAIGFDRRFVVRRNDPGSRIDDGGFTRPADAYQRDRTPFDWLFISGPSSATASLEAFATDAFVTATSDGSRAQYVLQRHAYLEPGIYRLRLSVRGSPSGAQEFAVEAKCADEKTLLAESTIGGLHEARWEKREMGIRVVAECPLIVLRIGSRGTGIGAQADFDNFSLVKASAAGTAPS